MAYQNNDQKQFQVSTSMLSMFDPSSNILKVGGLDSSLSIGVWTPSMADPSGKKTYPQEGRHSVILVPERVAALDHVIQNEILPAYKEGKTSSKGVFTNNQKTSIFEVRTEAGSLSCALYKGINEDRIPSEVHTFEFQKMPIVSSYNPKTGDFEMEEIEAQFYLFSKLISAFALEGCTGSSAHGMRFANRYVVDKVFRSIEAIATKLGAEIAPSASFGNSAPRSGFGNESSAPALPGPEMREVDSIEGFL